MAIDKLVNRTPISPYFTIHTPIGPIVNGKFMGFIYTNQHHCRETMEKPGKVQDSWIRAVNRITSRIDPNYNINHGLLVGFLSFFLNVPPHSYIYI